MEILTHINHSGGMVSAAVERRLTLHLMAYWERMRGAKPLPSEADINPEELNDLWDDCFLIHTLDLSKNDYNFVYLGDNIKLALAGNVSDDQALFSKSLNVKRLSPAVEKAIKTKLPVIEEGSLMNDLNQLVKYRQCLLPMGDSNKVLAVFGGMRCKVYPNEHAIQ